MGGTWNAIQNGRLTAPWYRDRIRGRCLDVGGGTDALAVHRQYFPNVTAWTVLDTGGDRMGGMEWIQADACDLPAGRQWDTIYSSHCLEHVTDHVQAFEVWWEALAPGGHLIVIVPHWVTYERETWPSSHNGDHKTAWVMTRSPADGLGHHVWGLVTLACGVMDFGPMVGGQLLRATTLDDGFDPSTWDQTTDGSCECSLEIVLRKNA